jgi:hypothetical protein
VVLLALEALGKIGGDASDVLSCASALRSFPHVLRHRALAAILRIQHRRLDSFASELARDWWEAAGTRRFEMIDALRTAEGLPLDLADDLLAVAKTSDASTRLQLLGGPLASLSPKSIDLTRYLAELAPTVGDLGSRALMALRTGIPESERLEILDKMMSLAESSPSADTRQLAIHVVSAQGDPSVVGGLRRIAESSSVDHDTRSAAAVAIQKIQCRFEDAPLDR